MEQYINELENDGYTIIPKILSDNECTDYSNKMWCILEHLTNNEINKNNEESYKNIYKLYPLHSMLIQHYNIGHSQFIWDLRQDDRIIDIFTKLYKHFLPNESEELLVSFDGVSQHMPPEITKRGWLQENNGVPKYPWYHSDQSFTKTFNKKTNTNNFSCLQSWITFNNINKGDATLSVIKGSHKKTIRDEFKDNFNIINSSEWYKLNKNELKYFIDNKNLEIVDIICPKGSLVIWDSRTIHCGKEPLRNREQLNTRQVVYLSYQPKSLCSNANLKKRKKAFAEMRMTGHSSAYPKLFSKDPRTYGKELYNYNPITPPQLTNTGLALIS